MAPEEFRGIERVPTPRSVAETFARLRIFGNPRAGTPLTVAAPSLALDLPLKVLVSEDAAGRVWVSYDAPEYLQQRCGVPGDLLKNVSGVAACVRRAVA